MTAPGHMSHCGPFISGFLNQGFSVDVSSFLGYPGKKYRDFFRVPLRVTAWFIFPCSLVICTIKDWAQWRFLCDVNVRTYLSTSLYHPLHWNFPAILNVAICVVNVLPILVQYWYSFTLPKLMKYISNYVLLDKIIWPLISSSLHWLVLMIWYQNNRRNIETKIACPLPHYITTFMRYVALSSHFIRNMVNRKLWKLIQEVGYPNRLCHISLKDFCK